jgi:peroxiredoxin
MPRKNKVLNVGDRAPDFSLTDAVSGKTISLADLLGEPVLLIFLRGTW